MTSRRVVKLLTTGGTIATERGADGLTRPLLDAAQLRGFVADQGGPDVDIAAETLLLRPSWSLGPAEMDAIARTAVQQAHDSRFAGVVVTHGTTTLEYSAFLTDLRHDGRTPIVFTGAMRRADASEPDGPGNLRAAAAVAAEPTAENLGCLVVLAGRILSARGAWKAHKSRVDAFIDLSGDVGCVDGDRVEIAQRPRRTRTFSADLEPRTALVKAYPGAGRALIDAAVAAGNRGLVVEGLPGVGGVPEPMQAGLRDAVTDGVCVVLTSRAPHGQLPPDAFGGTGKPLADIGLVPAGDLTPEKAWILLMLALGEQDRPEHVVDVFTEVTAAGSALEDSPQRRLQG